MLDVVIILSIVLSSSAAVVAGIMWHARWYQDKVRRWRQIERTRTEIGDETVTRFYHR